MSETRKDFEERRRIYFEKNPTFEEWCDDVFFYIRHSSWNMKNKPDYSREEFDKDLEDAFVHGELEHCFRNREMPQQVAWEWELIIF